MSSSSIRGMPASTRSVSRWRMAVSACQSADVASLRRTCEEGADDVEPVVSVTHYWISDPLEAFGLASGELLASALPVGQNSVFTRRIGALSSVPASCRDALP
jgi:hypothetical protein